ncbi:AraC family transcriptional regulator [Nonomuraea africana]|uniref:AraC-like DNA-binding protein n=1 Tax=Nonomuraea africana TaxID=46171 RepID=A0ABR9KG67_9ACTN|nr:AraC family transcriptional regulator [Nonomuraea africana]MBE1560532.1 AraC-like DNA-binding protein [Nonomuraea africana]
MTLRLGEPPVVVNVGVGVHGVSNRRDVFLLPDLWQLHLYGYTARLTVGGTTQAIRPGHVSLIPPGERVSYLYNGRSEHLYAHLRLPDRGPERTVPLMQDAGAETPLLGSLLRQAVAVAPATPVMAAAEVWAALWRVAHLAEAAGPHAAVGAAIAHIESNLAEPLSVPAIARAAGISHNHLTRLFRAEIGDTVVGYIRRRRLEQALHLLRESTLPIPAVAAAVGIADLQAFNKACRRELGASPRAIRSRRTEAAHGGGPPPREETGPDEGSAKP